MNTTETRTLPSGDYPFTVTAFERGEFAGNDKTPSCNMAVLTIEMDGVMNHLRCDVPSVKKDNKTIVGDGRCQVSVDGVDMITSVSRLI